MPRVDHDSIQTVERDVRTSTPVKARRKLACQFGRRNEDPSASDKRQSGSKHDLTPGSKQHPAQPKSKRFHVGKSILL